jgi:hypothetical protein
MTTWRKGDVVLVPIGFTDQSGGQAATSGYHF